MAIKLLNKKSWHVYKGENIERVRRDEAQASRAADEHHRDKQNADYSAVVNALRHGERKSGYELNPRSAQKFANGCKRLREEVEDPVNGPVNPDKLSNLQFRHVVKKSWYDEAPNAAPGYREIPHNSSLAANDPLLEMEAQLAKRRTLQDLRAKRDSSAPSKVDTVEEDRYNPRARMQRRHPARSRPRQ